MTRSDFVKELEILLADMPDEDRNEAIQYYNNYFDDAGIEHEGEILTQLGSPQRIANMITAELKNNISEQERGMFTEKGYQDTIYEDEKYELINVNGKRDNIDNAGNEDSYNNRQNSVNCNYDNGNGPQGNNYSNGNNNAGKYSNNGNNNAGNYSSNGNTNTSGNSNGNSNTSTGNSNGNRSNNGVNTVLIILLCIFGMPLFFSGIGIIIAIVATIFALFIAFGLSGFCMIGAGLALFITGLIKLGTPLFGLAYCGAGLVVFGLGMLFSLLSIILCKSVLPATIKGIVNLCRLPFKNRSVMA